MQVRLYFWIWGCFNVIWSHFLFIFIEIGQLFLHILIFYSFFLVCDVRLLLVLDIFCSELLFLEESFIFFYRFILLRLSIFGFHFNYFGHGIKSGSASPEFWLILDPLESINDTVLFVEIYLFDHACSFFHFEEFQVVDDILDIKALLFLK
jgi:hypothetical protein